MNVDELKAGEELDRLIAENVMGWYKLPTMWCKGANSYAAESNWSPSTDIAAAWEVVEKLDTGPRHAWFMILERRISVNTFPRMFRCRFTNGITAPAYAVEQVQAWADQAPLAICLAALKVIE